LSLTASRTDWTYGTSWGGPYSCLVTVQRSSEDRSSDEDCRERAAAAALASVRAEGLEPSAEAQQLLERWRSGELTTEDLDSLAKRAAAGEPLTPVSPHAA
jgi:Antitoxin VbhA